MTELKGDYSFFGFTSTSAVLTKKRCPLLTTFSWSTSSRARNQSRPGLDIPFYHIDGTMLTVTYQNHALNRTPWLTCRTFRWTNTRTTQKFVHGNPSAGVQTLTTYKMRRLWRRVRERRVSGNGVWAEWQRIEWAASQLQCPLCITGNVWLEIVFLDHRLQYREVCNKSLHGAMHRCQLTVFSVCTWIAGSTTCLWAGAPLCYDSIMESQTYSRATYVLHPTTQRILWPYNYRVPEERLISMILIFEERTTRSLW